MSLLERLLRTWPRLPQLTPDDLLGRLASAQPPVLLDVRTTVEFASGHIAGAINIPHEQLPARAAELEAHRERDIVIYCRSGLRAGHAARALQKSGFVRLALLSGHIQSWQSSGHPVSRRH
jgi:rhodanese-related sulfurtransferase